MNTPMNETAAHVDQIVTLYYRDGVQMRRCTGKLVSADDWSVAIVPARCRKARVFMSFYHSFMVMLPGKDEQEMPGAWQEPEHKDGVSVTRGKYRSADPQLVTDFLAAVDVSSAIYRHG